MANTKDKKVMIIEDDKFFISLIAKKLSDSGFTSLFANDGKMAFEVLAKQTPDIILLDIMLPDIDGFEILTRLKKDEQLKNIPVVFLSNLGSKEDINHGKELGATDFLIKATVTMDEVVKEVEKVLKI